MVEYKNGQVWCAQWPQCWTVKLLYIKTENDQSLFVVEDCNDSGIFTREYNKEPHLFTSEAITRLIGEKAKPMLR